jgi:hypothetical protein
MRGTRGIKGRLVRGRPIRSGDGSLTWCEAMDDEMRGRDSRATAGWMALASARPPFPTQGRSENLFKAAADRAPGHLRDPRHLDFGQKGF